MKLYTFFGLEIDLISDYELLEAIEASSQLPIPEEQSIFSVKNPQLWLEAGQELRQALREELPHRLSEAASAFFLHILQEHGEGYSDLMVDADQSEALEEFWQGEWLLELWEALEVSEIPSSFRLVQGSEPFTFIYLAYEQLLEAEIPDWEQWLEEWQQRHDRELPEMQTHWLTNLVDTIEEAQIEAAERDGRPGLFIYPVIFPDLVYEVEEDEEPQLTLKQVMRWLRAVESGQPPDFEIPLFFQYHLRRYLELKLQRLQTGLSRLDEKSTAEFAQQGEDPRSKSFQETHALPDFLDEPRELILTLWYFYQQISGEK
mgnify:CR=1 FL=1